MIDLLFSGVQFLFFCMCCVYIVRKYIPAIKKGYTEELSRQKNLEERCDELKQSLHNADVLCQEEASGCNALLNKVVLWKESFEKQKRKEEEIQRHLFQQAQEKHQKQLRLREAQLVQLDLFPTVVHNARTLLQKNFLDPHAALLYNERCIAQLKSEKEEPKKDVEQWI